VRTIAFFRVVVVVKADRCFRLAGMSTKNTHAARTPNSVIITVMIAATVPTKEDGIQAWLESERMLMVIVMVFE